MQFARPEFLWLLALLPLLLAWEVWRFRRRSGGLVFSHVAPAGEARQGIWVKLRGLLPLLRMAALAFGILALARPQERNTVHTRFAEGVDIVLALDISTSMRAQDFLPNRFEAAREVASEFISERLTDRVGLVIFAGKAYTQAPLTLDYGFLQTMLSRVEMGEIEDGTAIGTALAMAVNRLKNTEAVSKVVILLTDGQNNRGEIDPVTAAELAQTLGVRVYAIGVGTRGEAPYVVNHPFLGRQIQMVKVEIDEDMLRTVAERTGGQYFRATDNEGLRAVYDEISTLERTKIEEQQYTDYEERYPRFLWPALALLLLEVVLSSTRLRTFP